MDKHARGQKNSVSVAERRRRQEAFDFAAASVELEGLAAPKEYDKMAQRYIEGKIEFDELAEFTYLLTRIISNKE